MRYHTTGHDDWSMPRQRRHADWGWGKIEPILADDTIWSCIRSGLGWMAAAVWGVAAVIAVFVVWR